MGDVEIIAKRLGGISTELEAIPKAITEAVEKLSESELGKKYYDENIAEIIKEAILSVLTKISVAEAGKNYYYGEVVELVKNALTEVLTKLGNPKIDLSPIMKMALDINSDNKKILDAILNLPKPETKDEKYQELLANMQKTNELLMLMISKKKTPVIDITPKREIESFKFVHKIEYNRIVETEAFPKYKK